MPDFSRRCQVESNWQDLRLPISRASCPPSIPINGRSDESARAILVYFAGLPRRSSSPYFLTILLVVAPCTRAKSTSSGRAGIHQTGPSGNARADIKNDIDWQISARSNKRIA